jgi:hypothetical protein
MNAASGMEAVMRDHCENRMTVLGSKREVKRFQESSWGKILHARYTEPLQFSPCRFICQFETVHHDLKRLQKLSRRWRGLVLLLDYEVMKQRMKGVAKVRAGELEHCEIAY